MSEPAAAADPSRPPTPVLVVGSGLLGTSVGLALRRLHIEVLLDDLSASHLALASSLGAGRPLSGDDVPALVVVATPPAFLAAGIASALTRWPSALVTDVGSVKSGVLAELRDRLAPSGERASASLSRYCGGHPMAGSERSGPAAASSELFDGRTWAVTPHESSGAAAIGAVESLALACGAVTRRLDPDDHDRAVARVSHVPHLMAALVAGLLVDAPAEHLALGGQGIRDTTRIAAGDPGLWRQIVGANAPSVRDLLQQVRGDLDGLIDALGSGGPLGDDTGRVLERGAAGVGRLPGKHGHPSRPTVPVTVVVPDRPGGLAHLFGELDAAGVNVEDLRIDHDPAREAGVVSVEVEETRAGELVALLRSQGWATHL